MTPYAKRIKLLQQRVAEAERKAHAATLRELQIRADLAETQQELKEMRAVIGRGIRTLQYWHKR